MKCIVIGVFTMTSLLSKWVFVKGGYIGAS